MDITGILSIKKQTRASEVWIMRTAERADITNSSERIDAIYTSMETIKATYTAESIERIPWSGYCTKTVYL